MERKRTLHISLPADLREWFEREAGARRMTMSDLAVALMTKGIAADTIDRAVVRLEAAVHGSGATREALKQALATRWLVSQLVKKDASMPTTIGHDANLWAERELAKLVPGNGGGEP